MPVNFNSLDVLKFIKMRVSTNEKRLKILFYYLHLYDIVWIYFYRNITFIVIQ